MAAQSDSNFPMIRHVGLNGMLVTFSDAMSEASNRACLAFCEAAKGQNWQGVHEVSSSLASVYVRFDPHELRHAALQEHLQALLAARNWSQAPLPGNRRFWQVPTVYGGELAPQLAEAAAAAGLSEAEAVERLSATRVRVLTIGFAPGQPYLGPLGEEWDLPRQSALTPNVPAGALVLAIRQFVLFTAAAPTGWRHVGQTGFRGFFPQANDPIALRAGDELQFVPVSKSELRSLCKRDPQFGGATRQEITE